MLALFRVLTVIVLAPLLVMVVIVMVALASQGGVREAVQEPPVIYVQPR